MEADAQTPLAQELRRLMREQGANGKPLGQKALALLAGVGETYVRDILKGRSKSPEAGKLKLLADALGCPPSRLLDLAGASEASELVDNPRELLLLSTWRYLPDQEQEAVLDFVKFLLGRLKDGREAV